MATSVSSVISDLGAPIVVACLWLIFGATHIGLGATRLRHKWGERRFIIAFVILAQFLFALVVLAHGGLKRIGAWTRFHDTDYELYFGIVAAAGMTFIVAGSLDYLRTPLVPLSKHTDETPLQRVTRHPVMIGLAVWGVARAAVGTQLVDISFFGGFAVVSLLGSWHLDRKLARTRDGYRAYLERTSFLPFAAMVRQRSFRQGPWLLLAPSIGIAYVINANHDAVFASYGAPLIAVFVAGTTIFTAVGLRRAAAEVSVPGDEADPE